ncbi:MAG: hypothetical protein EGS44_05895 [Akkermansia muciniphila]|nr:hypothetical protein [Akkermansia muciniphila]
MENGGAIAIRGFNYQKSIASLIAILNYKKENFEIFVENKDDIEVVINGFKTFIQVKGKKLSINSLLNIDNKSKESILSKNIKKGDENSRYKIVTLDSFVVKDKNDLIPKKGEIFQENIFTYSQPQIELIIKSLEKQGFSKDELINKLKDCYIYFSPFKNDQNQAIAFLIGKMTENDLKVDGNAGRIALNELFTQIDTKSEIIVQEDECDNDCKKITSSDLVNIFKATELFEIEENILEEVSKKYNFDFLKKRKIKRHSLEIISIHKSLKIDIMNSIGNIDLQLDTPLIDIFSISYKKIENKKDNKISEDLLFAIVINILAEKIYKET